LSIIVILNKDKYFVDVGYGEFFVKPLLLVDGFRNNIQVNSGKDEYFLHINKLTLKILDKPVDLTEMTENYIKFLKSDPGDMAINKTIFERIYNQSTSSYTSPKLVCRL
jgi:hypothetical protein